MSDPKVKVVLDAQNNTSAAFTQAQAGVEKLGTAVESLQTIAQAVGIAELASHFLELGKQALETGEQIALAAQKAGTSTEFISGLGYAAQLSGVQFDQLQTGLKFFSRAIGDTEAGIPAASRGFDALGISIKDASGQIKPTEQLLMEVADAFHSHADSAEKARIATLLFGRSGTELIPVLNQGSAGIDELMGEAKKMGLVLDDASAHSMRDAEEALKRLKASGEGAALQFMAGMVPSLEAVANALLGVDTQSSKLAGTWAGQEFLASVQAVSGVTVALAEAYYKADIAFLKFQADLGSKSARDELASTRLELMQLLDQWTKTYTALNAPPKPTGFSALGMGTPGDLGDAVNKLLGQSGVGKPRFNLGGTGGADGSTINLTTMPLWIAQWKQLAVNVDDFIKAGDSAQARVGIMALMQNIEDFKAAHPDIIFADLNKELQQLQEVLTGFSTGNPLLGFPQLGGLPTGANYTGSILALFNSHPNMDNMPKELQKQLQDLGVFLDAGRSSADKLNDAIQALDATFGSDRGSPQYIKALQAIREQLDTNTIAERQFGQEIGNSFAQGILHGQGFGQILKSLLLDVIKLIAQLTIMKSLEQSAGSGGVGGFFSNIGLGLFGGLFGGHALGGDFAAGMPFWAGEQGPELILPQTNGTVLNQGQLAMKDGFQGQFAVHLHAEGGNADEVRQLQVMVRQLRNDVPAFAAATVREMRRRGVNF